MIENPGYGKTHLSIWLDMKACYAGFNIKFGNAVNLANELVEADQFHGISKLEKSLSKVDC